MKKVLLHIAARQPDARIWTEPFKTALRRLGELSIVEQGRRLTDAQRAELIRQCHILLTDRGAAVVPTDIIERRGHLEYICHITGRVRDQIPIQIVEAGIPVTNWGDAPAQGLAEGAMALLLMVVKDLHARIQSLRRDEWPMATVSLGSTLEGLRVGLYGFGAVGRRFHIMLAPFRPEVRVYDPHVEQFPPDCIVAGSVEELFDNSDAIIVLAALTPETRGAIDGSLLARLPEGGIVVNVARGAIVDQGALFAELEKGRLRAGLDVLEPDGLPPGHPARGWENLVLSAHQIGKSRPLTTFAPERLSADGKVCLQNVERHLLGQKLAFVMDRRRYELTT
jgi:phosphoglycerate dehydrogenase-like enzyme